MSKLFLFAACLAALAAPPTQAQGKETLRGIQGVRVSVTVAGDEAKKDGLTEAAFRSILEERVRGAGLHLSGDDVAPRLSLIVNAQKYAEQGVYAVAVDLDLYQLVSLERATAPPFHASTWRVTQALLRPADDLGSLRAEVERAAGVFVKEYLSVNPRRQ